MRAGCGKAPSCGQTLSVGTRITPHFLSMAKFFIAASQGGFAEPHQRFGNPQSGAASGAGYCSSSRPGRAANFQETVGVVETASAAGSVKATGDDWYVDC